MMPVERGEGGKINFVKVFLLAAVVAAGYFGWIFVPIYLQDYQVVEVMRRAGNKAYEERSEDAVDAALKQGFKGLNLTDQTIGADGAVITEPFDYSSDDWTITFDQEPPAVNIDLSYDRSFVYPFTKKARVLRFHHFLHDDLSAIKPGDL